MYFGTEPPGGGAAGRLLGRQDVQSVLFHPRPGYGLGYGAPAVRLARFEVEPQVWLHGRLHAGPAGAPLLLLFHGNGEIAADYADLAPLFTALGLTLLVMDYRGYGGSSGAPTAANLLSDAHAVLAALPAILESARVRISRVVVMGRSLGSVPAIELAAERPGEVSGLIVESGFADTLALLARLGLGEGLAGAREETDGFDNGGKIARVSAPTLVIHGEADRLIPAEEGRLLYSRCGSRDKRLLIIPRGDHNDLFVHGEAAYLEAVRALVTSVPGATD